MPWVPAHASMSPDGRWVAYDGPDTGTPPRHDVLVVPTAGGTPRVVVGGPSDDLMPIWTADGHRLTWVSDRTGTSGLWLQAFEGGTPVDGTAARRARSRTRRPGAGAGLVWRLRVLPADRPRGRPHGATRRDRATAGPSDRGGNPVRGRDDVVDMVARRATASPTASSSACHACTRLASGTWRASANAS